MKRFQRIAVTTETPVDDELFIVAPDSQDIFHLDPTAAAIWRALEDPMTRDELVYLFHAAFPDVAADELASDVDAALTRLQEGGLLRVQKDEPGDT